MFQRLTTLVLIPLSFLALSCFAVQAQEKGDRLSLLFLGDNGHHQPPLRFKELAPALAERGIDLTYTDDVKALNAETLGDYAGLILYANIDELPAEQEKALLAYVEEQGKGFIPLHCASFCFRNSDAFVALVGAQFQRHGTGTFRAKNVAPDHPIMQGFGGFESFDETYVHTRHNDEGRTVLEVREEEKGAADQRIGGQQQGEPWTWVREQGKGRVFYTAWGHDSRTFTNPGFINLVERGIRWAVKDDPAKAPAFRPTPAFDDAPQMTALPEKLPATQKMQGKLPFYPAGEKWGTVGDPVTEFQAPLSPEDSRKLYTHPVGFELELVTSEPQIGKPLAMNWDERGRLWLLETVDYPNELQPKGKGRDRIRICEDTDGDGKIDQTKIFAEGLSIPTSLTFAHGGVIVHQAPETLFLRDDDGDDKADVRSVLFTGWSTNDTHAGPSNLVYGLDGWYYGQVGYAGFRGEIAGEDRNFRQGFYRFRVAPTRNRQDPLVVSEFEFLRNVNNNCWGVAVSEEGILFGSTANGNPSVHMPVANRYYEAVRGWSPSVLGTIATDDRIHPITDVVRQVDHHGGFTAAAGHALYTARQFPREWWNRTAFVTEPTAHLAATFTLQPDGSTFVAKNSWNLIAGVDEWQAPIMAEVGPDGSVWIIDWYNIVVQHNPTPAGFETGKGAAYVTDLRDKKHGRIYRLSYKGDASSDDASASGATNHAAAISLSDATPEQLVEALSDTNFFWRRHAHRLIAEGRAGDVTDALLALVNEPAVDQAGLAPAAMHAIWLLDAVPVPAAKQEAVRKAIADSLVNKPPGVMRAAAESIDDESIDAFASSGVLFTVEPQVRLAALLRASEFPSDEGLAEQIYTVAGDSTTLQDQWLTDAVIAAAAKHDLPFLKIALANEDKPKSGAQRSDRLDNVIARVAEHFARGKPEGDLNDLFVAMGQTTKAQSSVAAIAAGLEKGLPKEATAKLSAAADEGLAKSVANAPADLRSVLVRLGLSLGSQAMETYAGDLVAGYIKQIADGSLDGDKRIFAAQELVAFRPDDDQVVASILKQIQPQTPPDVSVGLLESLAKSQSVAVASGVADRFASLTPALRQRALSMLLSRAEWTDRLVTALAENDIPLSDLALDQRQALAAHPDAGIKKRAAELLMNAGGLPNADRQAAIDAYSVALTEPGDAVRGKELFVKECGKCHKMQGEGTAIGPDLTGMSVHPRKELLIHILDPSRSVEGNFRVYQAILADGRVRSGLLASETRTSIELVDAEAKRHDLLREDLEELVASSKSLMPEGFEKQLDVTAMTDLLAYMTKRGKYVPLDLSKVASAVSTKGMFYSEDAGLERLIFADWGPKTFEGVPFALVDPKEGRVKNALLFYGPTGYQPPKMPKQVELPLAGPVAAVHLLSGVSGWGSPASQSGTTSLTVRFTYADGQTEDHPLKNGVHFADYIRRVDVPESKFAFALSGGQQLRFLSVRPSRAEPLASVKLLKGPDDTAPLVMAATAEMRE